MSDTEKSTGKGWSDKERFVYLFALFEQAGTKPDFKKTPRPNGRSEVACQRMIDRLKVTLKDDLEALKAGEPINVESTPKKPPKLTPKRKTPTKASGETDGEGSPKKRGRKKKTDAESPVKTEEANGDVSFEDGEEI